MGDAADRSIPATPRRRAAAREEGAAPDATVPAFVAAVAVAVLLLPGWSRSALPAAGGFLRESLAAAFAARPADDVEIRLLFPAGILLPTGALVVATTAAGLGVRFLCDGSAWRFARAAPRWRRIDPAAGLARVFSLATLRAVAWNGLCLAGFVAAATCACGPIVALLESSTPVLEASPVIAAFRSQFLPVLLAAVAVAVARWGVARFAFERRLRMTPEEFKEEMRSLEADRRVTFERRRS